ncbi:MAG: dihydrodipicolinate synthase family protein, partial [Chloroflexota bacterium]
HYLGVADAVGLPIMLQDIGTAPLSPPLMARLSRSHERIRYAKVETLPTPPRFVETAAMAGDKLRLFGGANGQYFIEELNRGSRGTMQGIAIADVVRKVWDQYHGGDPDGAAMLWDRFSPLVKLCSIGQGMSPWLVKETLRRRGVISKAFPRLPARKPDDIAYRELHSLLDRLDLG